MTRPTQGPRRVKPPPAPVETEVPAPTVEENPPDREAAPEAANIDPPPTPTERAEASFTETRQIAEPREPAKVDVKN